MAAVKQRKEDIKALPAAFRPCVEGEWELEKLLQWRTRLLSCTKMSFKRSILLCHMWRIRKRWLGRSQLNEKH